MSSKEKFNRSVSRRDFGKMFLLGVGSLATGCREIEIDEKEQAYPTKTGPSVDTLIPESTTATPSITNTPEKPTATTKPTSTEIIDSVETIPFDPGQKIVVLEHHNPRYGLDNEESFIRMTPQLYEEQLKTMSDKDFYTPTENEILGWFEGKHGLPKKSAIIRIDIGVPYKDYELGFELLEKYDLRAIVFILTNMISDDGNEDEIGWDVIKHFVDKGVLIPGSHGSYHPSYADISEKNALWDALNSKEIIEEKLGREIIFFAYPYDAEKHEDLLLKHFRMLFGNFDSTYAEAANPLVGTFYPYIRQESFDWTRFNEYLDSVSQGGQK